MGKQKWQPVLLAVPEAMKKEVKNRFLDVSSNSEHDDIDFSFGSDSDATGLLDFSSNSSNAVR